MYHISLLHETCLHDHVPECHEIPYFRSCTLFLHLLPNWLVNTPYLTDSNNICPEIVQVDTDLKKA